jgi:hypothetical protein
VVLSPQMISSTPCSPFARRAFAQRRVLHIIRMIASPFPAVSDDGLDFYAPEIKSGALNASNSRLLGWKNRFSS